MSNFWKKFRLIGIFVLLIFLGGAYFIFRNPGPANNNNPAPNAPPGSSNSSGNDPNMPQVFR